MPGLPATIGQQIEALRKVGGDKVVKRIRREPDPVIQKIVSGWPTQFDAKRATALGFKAEATFEDILRIHVEDELGGVIA
jgi:D-erythronate 2-dehydrogenase